MIIPNIWGNKKCSKPPTRLVYYNIVTIHDNPQQCYPIWSLIGIIFNIVWLVQSPIIINQLGFSSHCSIVFNCQSKTHDIKTLLVGSNTPQNHKISLSSMLVIYSIYTHILEFLTESVYHIPKHTGRTLIISTASCCESPSPTSPGAAAGTAGTVGTAGTGTGSCTGATWVTGAAGCETRENGAGAMGAQVGAMKAGDALWGWYLSWEHGLSPTSQVVELPKESTNGMFICFQG